MLLHLFTSTQPMAADACALQRSQTSPDWKGFHPQWLPHTDWFKNYQRKYTLFTLFLLISFWHWSQRGVDSIPWPFFRLWFVVLCCVKLDFLRYICGQNKRNTLIYKCSMYCIPVALSYIYIVLLMCIAFLRKDRICFQEPPKIQLENENCHS